MLIAGLVKGINIDNLAHEMMEQHWAYDCDLADTHTLAKIALSVDIDPCHYWKSLILRKYSKSIRKIQRKRLIGLFLDHLRILWMEICSTDKIIWNWSSVP